MTGAYADLLRDARRRAGISQRELARRAGTSQAVISAYENALREPGVTQLQKVISAAGFDLRLTLAATPRPLRTGGLPWQLPDEADDDDRILENLRLSPVQRLRKMGRLRSFTSKYRGALQRQP
ncbi:MAG: helix-turn-helix domain-containing protein [Candidatus Dormibacteraeota bacterium]|nr:helix-turn-helix domain-containing protein [Candidatus Dormibacteraeota bacterium]